MSEDEHTGQDEEKQPDLEVEKDTAEEVKGGQFHGNTVRKGPEGFRGGAPKKGPETFTSASHNDPGPGRPHQSTAGVNVNVTQVQPLASEVMFFRKVIGAVGVQEFVPATWATVAVCFLGEAWV